MKSRRTALDRATHKVAAAVNRQLAGKATVAHRFNPYRVRVVSVPTKRGSKDADLVAGVIVASVRLHRMRRFIKPASVIAFESVVIGGPIFVRGIAQFDYITQQVLWRFDVIGVGR